MEKFIDILRKKGLEEFEVYLEETESHPVTFEQNELQSLESKVETGVGLRIIRDGRLGFSSTNDIDKPEEVVDFAIESSKFGEKVEFQFPEPQQYQSYQIFSNEGWPEKERIEIGRSFLEKLREFGSDIKIDMELVYARQRISIVNSKGLETHLERTRYFFGISGFTITESGFVWVYEQRGSAKPLTGLEDTLEKLIQKLELAKKVAKVKSGCMKVIFAPQALTCLLYPILMGVSGKLVAKKISPLTGKLDEKVLGENITILDDGTIPWHLGTVPFDCEGIPVSKKFLVEKGILRNYLLDLKTAAKLNLTPTGNAHRRYNTLPTPNINNLVLEPGHWTSNEMIRSLDYGIIVHSVIGAGQSNVIAGDFSVNIGLGFLVEKGEIVGRVKDTMVAGNVYDCFKKVYAISRDTETLGSYILPYVAFDGLSVTSKEQ